jgi:hypothetical protein
VKTRWNRIVLLCGALGLLALSYGGAASEAVDAYQSALGRWTQGYLIATIDMTVQIGENEPAAYSMKLWAKGNDTASSVIVSADADFLLGLAMLQEDRQVTAWWPTLERSKTFAASRTEEEIGIGEGWLDQVAQHPEEYEAVALSEGDTEWTVELHPLVDEPLFARGVVTIGKDGGTISGADFYDAEGQLLEQDRIDEYSEIVDAAGETIPFPKGMQVYDVEEDKTTSIVYSEIELPTSIDDSMFTLDRLKELSAQVLAGEL